MWPFSTKAEPAIEAKSLAEPDETLEAIFAGIVPGSVSVSTAQAMTVPAVQAAIRIISEAAASLDVKVVEIVDGVAQDRPDHQANKILSGSANEWTSGYELIRDLVAAALVHDRGGLAYVTKVRDEPREAIQYRPSVITVDYDSATGQPTYKLNNVATPADSIIHVRGPFNRSPLSLAREAIGTAKSMETYAGQFFQNGARPGGIIMAKKSVGDTGVKAMLKGWKEAFAGSANAGKTAVLWDETGYQQLTMNSTDAQFLENRKFQIIEIARAFRVPPAMLFDLDRATWSNGEQQGKEFLSYTLEPWLKVLETAFARALFTPEEKVRYRVVFDRDDLTRADLTSRAAAISSLITARVLNPNEARNWLGMPPRDGGNEYSNPAIDLAKPDTAANDNTPPPNKEPSVAVS
ncbi:phage portal protein [Rhizobium grahamii]|uniref:Phage portal protein n=1 Tax=Rhizobium grahamii TaxID=1120045 RepID=A0A5Q0C9K8_9HYPH|nr:MULTISPECIES: phage portal protein [Rhizobium]QFY60359.1 phage portal protein [Rhizobium grahamii]QRM50515.1 phage portal protein [Rhizobium sp. BG6]